MDRWSRAGRVVGLLSEEDVLGLLTRPAPPVITVIARGTKEADERRHAWIDNLRVTLIVGVIGAHVATAYVLDFDWDYEERTASTASEVLLGAIFTIGLLFGMGLLFLVAGLLKPPAFTRKGARRFAGEPFHTH